MNAPRPLQDYRFVGKALWRQECGRKRAFQTQKLAREALEKVPERPRLSMHIYHCHHCGYLHIGHRSMEHGRHD